MSSAVAPLAAYRGMRGELLLALKKAQPLTARQLAERFGVTPNALRRYLRELEQEGLIRYQREVRGVGGPVFAYVLTESGEEQFPRAYGAVLAEALEVLRAEGGEAAVVGVFERRWMSLARAFRARISALPPEQRARALVELLSAEGYMAEWSGDGSGGTLTEHNCAVRAVAARFPEVCAAEARFLRALLGGEVERRLRIVDGCNACEYVVRFAPGETSGVTALERAPARAGGTGI
jgi:DeoR family suf operon transcriptional repressor